MSTKNHDVFIFAKVMVKVGNIRAANQVEAVKQAIQEVYPAELNTLLTKELAPWESRCHATQLEEKAPLMIMVDQDPDGSGEIPCITWWQMYPTRPNEVEPMQNVAAADQRSRDAIKFLEQFLLYYDRAVLFAWDDRVMKKLVAAAREILNRNVLIGADDDNGKQRQSA